MSKTIINQLSCQNFEIHPGQVFKVFRNGKFYHLKFGLSREINDAYLIWLYIESECWLIYYESTADWRNFFQRIVLENLNKYKGTKGVNLTTGWDLTLEWIFNRKHLTSKLVWILEWQHLTLWGWFEGSSVKYPIRISRINPFQWVPDDFYSLILICQMCIFLKF